MRKGFTLIELVMVIVILAILAAIVLPRFVDLQTKAKEAATKGALGGIRAAVAIEYASRAAYDITPHIPPDVTAIMFKDNLIPYAEVGVTRSNTVTNVVSPPAIAGSGWAYIPGSGNCYVNHSDYTDW